MDNFKLFLAFCALVIIAGMICAYDMKRPKEPIKQQETIERTADSINTNTDFTQTGQEVNQQQPITVEKQQEPVEQKAENFPIQQAENNPSEPANNIEETKQAEEPVPEISMEELQKQMKARQKEVVRKISAGNNKFPAKASPKTPLPQKTDNPFQMQQTRTQNKNVYQNNQQRLPVQDNGKVTLTCFAHHKCPVSNNGLTIHYANIGASTTAAASRYYTKGKYYLEAEYKTEPNFKITAHNNIGIIADQGYKFCFLRYIDEKEYPDNCTSYGVLDFHTKMYDGDIIGLAIDLDNGKLYYSHNGGWMIGEPQNLQRGITLKRNLAYRAALQVGHNVYFNVNFGTKPFRYPIPKGYKAYN